MQTDHCIDNFNINALKYILFGRTRELSQKKMTKIDLQNILYFNR